MFMKKYTIIYILILAISIYIPVSAESIFAPQGNYTVFEQNGLYGIRNESGNIVMPAKFDGIEPIVGDFCVVDQRGMCGLWNLSEGRELLPCEYEAIYLSDDLIAVVDSDTFIDQKTMKQLEIDIPIRHIYPPDGPNFLIDYTIDDEVFVSIVCQDGTVVLPYETHSMIVSKEGIVWLVDHESYNVRYYDIRHSCFIGESYWYGSMFVNGYAIVIRRTETSSKEYFLINELGQQVTAVYDEIALGNEPDEISTEHGLFAYREKDAWYVGQVTGAEKSIISLAGPFDCVTTPIYLGNGMFAFSVESGTYVYSATVNDQILLDETYEIVNIGGQSAAYWKNGHAGYLFPDFNMIDPLFDGVQPFFGSHTFVRKQGLWYIVNRDGIIDDQISYQRVDSDYQHTQFICKSDEEVYYCYDKDAKLITVLLNLSN